MKGFLDQWDSVPFFHPLTLLRFACISNWHRRCGSEETDKSTWSQIYLSRRYLEPHWLQYSPLCKAITCLGIPEAHTQALRYADMHSHRVTHPEFCQSSYCYACCLFSAALCVKNKRHCFLIQHSFQTGSHKKSRRAFMTVFIRLLELFKENSLSSAIRALTHKCVCVCVRVCVCVKEGFVRHGVLHGVLLTILFVLVSPAAQMRVYHSNALSHCRGKEQRQTSHLKWRNRETSWLSRERHPWVWY